MASFQYTLESGRRIGITPLGEPAARRVVIFCGAAPGSSMFDPDPHASNNRNVHILGFDRPGYGSSDPLPDGEWPTVAKVADDMGEYLRASENTAHGLDQHEFDRVGVVGWGAGGTVALALAAQHPDLVDRVAVIGTPAPNAELPWIDPRVTEIVDRFSVEESADDALNGLVDLIDTEAVDYLPAQDPEEPAPLGLLGIGRADEAALDRPGVRQRLGVMMRDAFRQGSIGLATDFLAYTTRPLDFDFSDVHAKTLVLYGEHDELAGQKHAVWYRKNIADAKVEMVPEVGRLAIVPAWERVLSFLAPGVARRI